MAKKQGSFTPVVIPGSVGSAREDEAPVQVAGSRQAVPQDAPSQGTDPGDTSQHEIVMAGDEDGGQEIGSDSEPLRGVSANSFTIPGLDPTAPPAPPPQDGSFTVASVIGADDRHQIGNTRKYPFRAICALLMTGANGKQAIGTGWFAGPNLIVTAGHNLYDNDFIGTGWIQQVQIWPGRNGSQIWESEVATQSQLGVSDAWQQRTADRSLLDYGVIRLTSDLGKKVGWFGLRYWPSNQLQGKQFNVVGYPQEQTGIGPYTMWYDIGSITAARQKTIEYEMDTTPGESGSPVVAWVDDRTDQGSMIVVGIHNYGDSGFNRATRITPSVLDSISKLAK